MDGKQAEELSRNSIQSSEEVSKADTKASFAALSRRPFAPAAHKDKAARLWQSGGEAVRQLSMTSRKMLREQIGMGVSAPAVKSAQAERQKHGLA